VLAEMTGYNIWCFRDPQSALLPTASTCGRTAAQSWSATRESGQPSQDQFEESSPFDRIRPIRLDRLESEAASALMISIAAIEAVL
jgi:hypothetical protein